MLIFESLVVCSCHLSLLAVGILSMLLARLCERSAAQLWGQRVFATSLVLVAVATLAAATLESPFWPLSGMTLGLMVIGALVDMGSSEGAEVI